MEHQITIPQIVDSETIMNILSISKATLCRYKKKGIIPYLRIGDTHRFQVDKVIRAIEVQQENRKK